MPLPPALAARLAARGIAGQSETTNSAKFIPAPAFDGTRSGFVFKKDHLGLGYYADERPQATPTFSHPQNQRKSTQAASVGTTQTIQPLPTGWKVVQKKGSDEVYYWHTATGKTSWERPVATKPEVLEACSDKRSPQGSLNSAPIVDETGLVRSDTDDRDIEDGVRSDVDEEDEAYEARKRARKETDEERAAAEAVATETYRAQLDAAGLNFRTGTAEVEPAVIKSEPDLYQPSAHESCWKCGSKKLVEHDGVCAACKQHEVRKEAKAEAKRQGALAPPVTRVSFKGCIPGNVMPPPAWHGGLLQPPLGGNGMPLGNMSSRGCSGVGTQAFMPHRPPFSTSGLGGPPLPARNGVVSVALSPRGFQIPPEYGTAWTQMPPRPCPPYYHQQYGESPQRVGEVSNKQQAVTDQRKSKPQGEEEFDPMDPSSYSETPKVSPNNTGRSSGISVSCL